MLTTLILSVSLALIVSTICSLVEAALYSLPLSYVELLTKTHPTTAKILKNLKGHIDKPITAVLTLNTLAHTIGAAMAGASAAAVLGEDSLGWFSAIFTLAILLISEILPKTIGLVYNKQLALYIALPLQWLVIILYPIIFLCQAVTYLVPNRNRAEKISAEELQAIAMLSRKAGAIEREQEAVITNILHLGDKTVRQVMTPRTVTFSVDQNMTVAEAAELHDSWSMHSRAPVYDTDLDEVVGLLLSKDLFMAVAREQDNLTVRELMRPVHFVPETAALNQVFLEYFERHQHLFVVVDEYGSVTGVISMEDIIEEIVGREIIDESDRARNMREFARIRKKKEKAAGGEPNPVDTITGKENMKENQDNPKN